MLQESVQSAQIQTANAREWMRNMEIQPLQDNQNL